MHYENNKADNHFRYIFFLHFVVLLFYVRGKHLSTCRDGQFTVRKFTGTYLLTGSDPSGPIFSVLAIHISRVGSVMSVLDGKTEVFVAIHVTSGTT